MNRFTSLFKDNILRIIRVIRIIQFDKDIISYTFLSFLIIRVSVNIMLLYAVTTKCFTHYTVEIGVFCPIDFTA